MKKLLWQHKPFPDKNQTPRWPRFAIIPVLLPALISMAALDAHAADPVPEQSASASDRPAASCTTTLKELCLTPKAFSGKEIVVVGMVQRNPEAEKIFGKNSFVLFRRVITCCEDDAKTAGVIVANPAQSWEDKTWLRVRGSFLLQDTSHGLTLVLTNAKTEKIAAPKSVYLR